MFEHLKGRLRRECAAGVGRRSEKGVQPVSVSGISSWTIKITITILKLIMIILKLILLILLFILLLIIIMQKLIITILIILMIIHNATMDKWVRCSDC